MKRRVRSYDSPEFLSDERRIGIVARSRKLCSCWMCGNPRKYFKHPTLQEIKALEEGRLMQPQADGFEDT